MFKEGDLFFLNEDGKILFQNVGGENGLIVRGPYKLFEHDLDSIPEKVEYEGYDVLIKGILFKEIPEKFLERVTRDEKDVK